MLVYKPKKAQLSYSIHNLWQKVVLESKYDNDLYCYGWQAQWTNEKENMKIGVTNIFRFANEENIMLRIPVVGLREGAEDTNNNDGRVFGKLLG